MTLSADEKATRKFERMLGTARQYQTGTYSRRFVAPKFQKMIRAEFGSAPDGIFPAVIADELTDVRRQVGQCVCVTCGKVESWSGGLGGMHTGHFVSSRCNSILYCEDNVAPQCSRCNVYESGAPQQFRQWMESVRGVDVISRVRKLKTQTVRFSLDELVAMRIGYEARLKAAELIMEGK